MSTLARTQLHAHVGFNMVAATGAMGRSRPPGGQAAAAVEAAASRSTTIISKASLSSSTVKPLDILARHSIALIQIKNTNTHHGLTDFLSRSIVGGDSLGCLQNAGAAGTLFDVTKQSLMISNNKKQSKTDTVLLDFPVRPLWGSVLVQESARIGVPLHWSTIRVNLRNLVTF